MHHRENTLLSWRQPLLASPFPPGWCQLSAPATFQAGRRISVSLAPLSPLLAPRRTDGSGIRGNYLNSLGTVSINTPDEKTAKINPKEGVGGKSVKDFLTSFFFSLGGFFFIIFCFLLTRPGTEPGVFSCYI